MIISLAPGETNLIGSRPLTQAEADALYFPIDGDIGGTSFGVSQADVEAAIQSAIQNYQLLSKHEADQLYLSFETDFHVQIEQYQIQLNSIIEQELLLLSSNVEGLVSSHLVWDNILNKPEFDAIYRKRADPVDWVDIINTPPLATDWGSILDKPDVFPSATHSSTHHLGGTDEISAEAIGAEAEGVAQSLIITHIGEPNPHPQYRPRNEGIPWEQIINAPSSSSPPPTIFTPFTGDGLTLITGSLPTVITISDSPAGNDGLITYLASAGSQCRGDFFQLPSTTLAYRVTCFARVVTSSVMGLAFGFYRVTLSGGFQFTPFSNLTLTSTWQQYDLSVTNVDSSNTFALTFAFTASGNAGNSCQVYGPQFSVAS